MDVTDRSRFRLGVCYYPEQWPRERWPLDARSMRDMGLSYVRLAEFAWSRMEPEPGRFDWQWLDDAIEILASEGLQIVLCTPTATPPAWLIRAHPEILPIDEQGRVRNFGSRKHYDHASPIYREHTQRITREIAGRYGRHEAVVGWQTDNEWGCHSTTRSYGGASRLAFREWLRHRYGSLDALNRAWGTVFWSQEYTDWDQIDPPNLTVAEPNPSHALDYYRFASDMVAEFQAQQVRILRELSPGRWITHNFMMQFPEFDHFHVCEGLDFASWDSYPLGQLHRSTMPEEVKLRFARTGHPDLISFNHDLYRCLLGPRPFWVMEQGVGQVNWATSNCLPVDGAPALWLAQAFAHGAETVSVFRWRAATAAQELMHSALLRHDATSDRGAEELARLEIGGRAVAIRQAEVALLHDYESLWVNDLQPHAEGAVYWRLLTSYYSALRSLGVDVDIRHPDHDLSGYRLIVAAGLQLVGEERAAHLQRYAGDATFVFGPRCGFRLPNGRVHEDGPPGPLRELTGCNLANFDGLRPGLTEAVGPHVVHTWAENYRLLDGSVRDYYTTGPLAGTPAVVEARHAYTIGAWSETLVTEVLEEALGRAGLASVRLPEGLRVSRIQGTEMWMNFAQQPAVLPDGSEIGPVSFSIRETTPAREASGGSRAR